jgi:uncharacterized hydrophobic protein (TIGR00271 family)
MPLNKVFELCQTDRHKFCANIIDSSSPRGDFYFLVILSSLIVALGLLADNIILVIGGMLVTPLLSPLLAISLGIVIGDFKVTLRSVKVFLSSFLFAFVVAYILGFFSTIDVAQISLIKIMEPSLFTFVVAVIAGLAASYTWAKPNLNEALPGIAVTVTLIPPLTAIGLAAASNNWPIFNNVLQVLLLNIFGIILASLIILTLMDFYKARKKAIKEVKQEEKELEKERKD